MAHIWLIMQGKKKRLAKNKPTDMPEFCDPSSAYSQMQITKFSQLLLGC